MSTIIDIHAREILDSRGNPTVEVDVISGRRHNGRAAVPSGASTGAYEAVEKRDGDKSRYMGKGVLERLRAVNGKSQKHLVGIDAPNKSNSTDAMIELDGTDNKAALARTRFLGVSLAAAKAAADFTASRCIATSAAPRPRLLPVPMMNIINGGEHADNPIDIQEFMIMPVAAKTSATPCAWARKCSTRSKKELSAAGLSTGIGDEGGFAPNISSTRDALDFILKSIEKAGYRRARTSIWPSIAPRQNTTRTANMT